MLVYGSSLGVFQTWPMFVESKLRQAWLENTELKEKLAFYETKGKWVVITEATEEDIESYDEIIENDEETALSQNTNWDNNLLNLDCILELKDGYKVHVKGIINTMASKCYTFPNLIPSKYIESDFIYSWS